MAAEMKYKDWLQKWMTSKDGFVKEATFANYSMAIVNHIIPALGEYRMSEITEEVLQKTVLEWLERGRMDHGGGLSEKTVKDMLMIVKISLKAARKKLSLPQEEMDVLFPKTDKVSKLKVLSSESQQNLVQSILLDLSSRNAGILLCLHTGMRIGELCALKWDDIDLEHRTVSVTKTMQRIFIKELDGTGSTRVIITPPKTRSSARVIPISTFLLPVLRKVRPSGDGTYFLTGTEEYLEPRTYRSYYDRFLKRNEIPHVNFHGLRHTFATRCIEAGADYKTVSELLGHASVNMTLNLYVHPQMDQKRKCVELMQFIL